MSEKIKKDTSPVEVFVIKPEYNNLDNEKKLRVLNSLKDWALEEISKLK